MFGRAVRSLVADLPREVLVLASVAFAVAVGFGVVAPAIPLFAREFGVGRTAAGAVISAFAAMRLVSALGSGRLVDRLGERGVLASGIAIVAGSTALAGAAQSYSQLLLLRAAGGVGSAMFTVSAVSLLLRVAAPDQRARASGLFQGGFLVGGVAGPAFGGPLTEWSLRAPFFVYAVTLAVAGGIGMAFLSHAQLSEGGAQTPDSARRTSLRAALGSRGYRAALVNNLATGWTLFGIRASLIPLFVVEGLRRDVIWTGIALLVSSLAQAVSLLPAGRFADRTGRRPVLVTGAVLATTSMGLIAVSTSVELFVAAMVLFGVGSGLVGVASGAVVGDVVTGPGGGTVVAAFQMAADIGAVVGPLLAGWLADEYSYAVAFGTSAAVLGAGAVMALRMPETRPAAAAAGAT
ncbi:MAG: MFS transporter [Actinomycetota bacterium]|nr:MFS transporter [Actinomycetota bacterium]